MHALIYTVYLAAVLCCTASFEPTLEATEATEASEDTEEFEFEDVDIVDPTGMLPGARIIGGTSTPIQRYPYTVQIFQTFSTRQFICGGSLITRRHVLSAAHCFVTERGSLVSPRQLLVRAGSTFLTDADNSVQARRVRVLMVHERYNRFTQDSDVAVLMLRSPVTLGPTVQTAALPVQGAEMNADAQLVHVGWGATEVGGPPSTMLLEVTVRKVDLAECARRYRRLMQANPGSVFVVTRNMICAGKLDIGGADACQGDSGGPLICNLNRTLVVGVTSWGYQCGLAEFPGVSARVSNFTDWIQAAVRSTTVQRSDSSPSLSLTNSVVLIATLLASLALFKEV